MGCELVWSFSDGLKIHRTRFDSLTTHHYFLESMFKMLVKIVENEEYVMTEDFKNWIKCHQNDIFKVKKEIICNDRNPGYILFKVPFRVSKHFTIKVD